MVPDVTDTNVGLFIDFTSYGVLEALARFDESCDRGVPSLWPIGLTAEHAAIAVCDEHDDSGVSAWKNFLLAVGIATAPSIATCRGQ